jgi:hypothetical protein
MALPTIFISIAAYRDPELIPTVRDALSKATEPSRLHFAICLQEEPGKLDSLREYEGDARFQILKIEAANSRGCCWARAQLQKLYQDEEYALQLDSHHRFVQGWDALLIEWLAQCPSEKPVLTSYLPPYSPVPTTVKIDAQDCMGEPMEHLAPSAPSADMPCRIVALAFSEWDTVAFAPRYITDWREHSAPLPSAFFSAHFCFSKGVLVSALPYDAELYFTGEEDTLALRLYTLGWDLYAPHRVVAYHYYSRAKRAKHWEDHSDWWRLNEVALGRVQSVLEEGAALDGLGCGAERSAQAFWQQSGVNYACRSLQPWAKHGLLRSQLSKRSGTRWLHDRGAFAKHPKRPDTWVEYSLRGKQEQAIALFREGNNDNDELLLIDAARQVQLRITERGECWFKGAKGDWQLLYTGLWCK